MIQPDRTLAAASPFLCSCFSCYTELEDADGGVYLPAVSSSAADLQVSPGGVSLVRPSTIPICSVSLLRGKLFVLV